MRGEYRVFAQSAWSPAVHLLIEHINFKHCDRLQNSHWSQNEVEQQGMSTALRMTWAQVGHLCSRGCSRGLPLTCGATLGSAR